MSAGWRVTRALFAALAATAVALILHVRAGGTGSVLAVSLSFIGVAWPSVMMAGRRLTLPVLTLLAAGAQVYVHGVMAVVGPWRLNLGGAGLLSMTVGTHGSAGGHVYGGMQATSAMSSGSATTVSETASAPAPVANPGDAMSGHMGAAGMMEPTMLTAHVVALLLTVVALRWGESMLSAAVGVLTRTVRGLVEFRRPQVIDRRMPVRFVAPVFCALRVVSTPRIVRGPPARSPLTTT